MLWKEAAEPGTVLEPPPGTELAVPEASEVRISLERGMVSNYSWTSILTEICIERWLEL